MIDFLTLFGMALLGIVIHYLKRLWFANENDTISEWLKPGKVRRREILSCTLSILCSVGLIIARNDIKTFYPIGIGTALVMGGCSQAVLTALTASRTPKGVPPPSEE